MTFRWDGARPVGSIDLGLYRAASRPTEVTISQSGRIPDGEAVPRTGGIVRFAPMTTDTLTVRFTS